MKSARRRPVLGAVLAALAAVLLLVAGMAPGAAAAGGLDRAAAALRHGPVYVDPRAADRLPAADADALANKIKKADKPVFVAVLPAAAEFHPQTLLRDLRTKVGIAGVYAVALGNRFDAGADSAVMSRNAVSNLTGAVERSAGGSAKVLLNDFVDQAVQQAHGRAPASWSDGSPGVGGTGGAGALVALLVVAAVACGGVMLVARRGRKRREEGERAQLRTLRPVVDEDITAFGEELDRIGFDPSAPSADDAMRKDYTRALDSYDKAKAAMDTARRPADVQAVTQALEEGRFWLATLEARRAGAPLPERRLPCFFDPRHGPSVQDVLWAPPDGAERSVPVCAADAARLADGEEPMSRTVDTPYGRRPYWEAGPVYSPWVGGYFGGVLPGLLVGTLLGNMLSAPSYGYGYEEGGGFGDFGGGPQGGDDTGSDFSPGDFGGGFDGGSFGGGDFGGGDGF